MGIDTHKVHGWIRSGRLIAHNIGDAQRPRWRIRREDYEQFLLRLRTPAKQETTPRRPRKPVDDIIEYIR